MSDPRQRRLRSALRLGVACLPLLSATSAFAQGAGETAAARADALFREGKAALEARHFGEACPKLAESQRLDPGTGTLLALALCHEGTGATASAWREFKEVYDASLKTRPDRAALAQKHVQTLQAALSVVTVTVPTELRAHAEVRMDGDAVAPATWAEPIAADPGDHVIEVQVPGGTPWKTTVHLGPNHDSQTVTVPTPEPGSTAAAARSGARPSAPMGTRHKVGWIVGGGGAVLLVVGGVFGGLALSQHSSATGLCPASPCKSAAGVSDNSDAQTSAWVADFGVGIGLAALGAAAYLLLTPDDAPATTRAAFSPRLVPTATPGGGGLSVVGTW